MFKLIFADECTYDVKSLDEIVEIIFNVTCLWQFANHVKDVCSKSKSGDKYDYHDVGLTVECL